MAGRSPPHIVSIDGNHQRHRDDHAHNDDLDDDGGAGQTTTASRAREAVDRHDAELSPGQPVSCRQGVASPGDRDRSIDHRDDSGEVEVDDYHANAPFDSFSAKSASESARRAICPSCGRLQRQLDIVARRLLILESEFRDAIGWLFLTARRFQNRRNQMKRGAPARLTVRKQGRGHRSQSESPSRTASISATVGKIIRLPWSMLKKQILQQIKSAVLGTAMNLAGFLYLRKLRKYALRIIWATTFQIRQKMMTHEFESSSGGGGGGGVAGAIVAGSDRALSTRQMWIRFFWIVVLSGLDFADRLSIDAGRIVIGSRYLLFNREKNFIAFAPASSLRSRSCSVSHSLNPSYFLSLRIPLAPRSEILDRIPLSFSVSFFSGNSAITSLTQWSTAAPRAASLGKLRALATSPLSLPDEVLAEVLAQLDSPYDLCQCALVCRRLCDLARNQLYHTPAVCNVDQFCSLVDALFSSASAALERVAEDAAEVSRQHEMECGTEITTTPLGLKLRNLRILAGGRAKTFVSPTATRRSSRLPTTTGRANGPREPLPGASTSAPVIALASSSAASHCRCNPSPDDATLLRLARSHPARLRTLALTLPDTASPDSLLELLSATQQSLAVLDLCFSPAAAASGHRSLAQPSPPPTHVASTVTAIALALPSLAPRLCELSLACPAAPDSSAVAGLAALAPTLTVLRLRLGHSPDAASVDANVAALLNRCGRLRVVDFAGTAAAAVAGDAVYVALFGSRTRNAAAGLLEEINVAGCTGLFAVQAALELQHARSNDHQLVPAPAGTSGSGLCALRSLNLTGASTLTDAHLACILAETPRLESLYLARCRGVTDAGLRAVASSAAAGATLSLLHLAHCSGVSDDGIVAVARGCRALEFVDLGSLRVTDDSVSCLLASAPRLRRVSLVKCPALTDVSLHALAGNQHVATTLDRLHLSFCPSLTLYAVGSVVMRCEALTYLTLTGCTRVLEGASPIMDLVRWSKAPPMGQAVSQQPARANFCVLGSGGIRKFRALVRTFVQASQS
ncbi:hypothetical protein DFJ73DRAFT_957390 [Zopfochytrium polystomum]|nr:hypothetical protein DFJ73DRAFT_957390 [Zopfochytrium polystomum]